jgi:uncharacterized protein
MKLCIISDIHGSLESLETALAAFEREGASHLVILGDYLNHGPRNPIPGGYAPDRTAVLHNRYREKILGVRGNCDSEIDQMLLEFPMMGDYAIVLDQGRRLFLTHGHGLSPERLPPLEKGDVFLSGHTHIPSLKLSDGIVLMNPGSVTLPKGGNPRTYGLASSDGSGMTLEIRTMDGASFAALSC